MSLNPITNAVREAGTGIVQPVIGALDRTTAAVGEDLKGAEETVKAVTQDALSAIAAGIGQLLQLGRQIDGATVTVDVTAKVTARIDLAKEIPTS